MLTPYYNLNNTLIRKTCLNLHKMEGRDRNEHSAGELKIPKQGAQFVVPTFEWVHEYKLVGNLLSYLFQSVAPTHPYGNGKSCTGSRLTSPMRHPKHPQKNYS